MENLRALSSGRLVNKKNYKSDFCQWNDENEMRTYLASTPETALKLPQGIDKMSNTRN